MPLVDKILSPSGLAVLAAMLVSPYVWSHLPDWEGRLFPVLDDLEVVATAPSEAGVSFTAEFTKQRDCTFQGIVWRLGDVQLVVTFEGNGAGWPDNGGGRTTAGPMTVSGVTELAGTHAIVVHRCHPLWFTHTHFYPPYN